MYMTMLEPETVSCPYCNKLSELVDSSEVYGKSYGYMYICWDCKAYVGCHKGTVKPLGTLANAELRDLRKQCHAAFDPIWQSGKTRRKKAYKELSLLLGIPVQETHFAMFDKSRCLEALSKIITLYKERN